MWIFLTTLLIIIILIVFFLCQKWCITIQYYGGELTIKIGTIKLFSTKKHKKEVEKYIKIQKASLEDIIKRFDLAKEIYKEEKHEIVSTLKELERRIEFKMLNISITFGFGDAAITGIANGFIWTGITGITSIIKRHIDIENKTNIAVYPHYTESCFDIDVCVIFNTRFIRLFGIYQRAKRLYKRNKCKFKELRLVV